VSGHSSRPPKRSPRNDKTRNSKPDNRPDLHGLRLSKSPGAGLCRHVLRLSRRFPAICHRVLAGFNSLSDHAYGIYLVHYVVDLAAVPSARSCDVRFGKAATVFGASLLLRGMTTAAVCRIPIGARVLERIGVPCSEERHRRVPSFVRQRGDRIYRVAAISCR